MKPPDADRPHALSAAHLCACVIRRPDGVELVQDLYRTMGEAIAAADRFRSAGANAWAEPARAVDIVGRARTS